MVPAKVCGDTEPLHKDGRYANGKEAPMPAKRQRLNNGEAMSNGAGSVIADYDRYFSEEGRSRGMPALRTLVTTFTGVPGIIGLHGGLPPASAFPFTGISLKLRDGTSFEINDPAKVAAAQQYSVAPRGYDPLLSWVTRHTRHMHTLRPHHDIMITNGSNATIESIFRLFLNPGDSLLCEEFTYPHIHEAMAVPGKLNVLAVPIDREGIIPEALAAVLEQAAASGQPRPRLLYTIPTGQNPTGAVAPLERRQAVYKVCQQHDVILLEDDPYFYLQFRRGPGGSPGGLANLGTSYLSLDTDGRVIRLDSFAKVLAPGLRLGWVTAAAPIIQKLVYYLHGISLGSASISQVLVAELLEHWGEAGFESHVLDMQREYGRRAAIITQAGAEHLQGLATWEVPEAGMFLWLKLTVEGLADAGDTLDHLKEEKVVVVPGRICSCLGPAMTQPCPYARLSFANATDEELVEGIARFATALHAFRPAAPADDGHAAPADTHERDRDLMRLVSGGRAEVISRIPSHGPGGLVGGQSGALKGHDVMGTC